MTIHFRQGESGAIDIDRAGGETPGAKIVDVVLADVVPVQAVAAVRFQGGERDEDGKSGNEHRQGGLSKEAPRSTGGSSVGAVRAGHVPGM